MKKTGILSALAAVATFVAAAVATSACYFFVYQPEEPESLRD